MSAFAVAIEGERTWPFALHMSAFDPKRPYPFRIVSLSRYDGAPETGSSNEAARVHHLGG